MSNHIKQSLPGPAPTPSGLIYRKCSLKELKAFAGDRGIRVPSPKRKWQYVNALQYADNNRTFHGFLRLPPELRNIIYTYLLVLQPSRKKPKRRTATTQLLVISRAVHKEARGILYSMNGIDITFSFRIKASHHGVRSSIRVALHSSWSRKKHGVSFPELSELWHLWPCYLKRLQHLHITVEFKQTGSRPVLDSLWLYEPNHLLHCLYSFLRGPSNATRAHSLKTLKVSLVKKNLTMDIDIESIMYPICCLGLPGLNSRETPF